MTSENRIKLLLKCTERSRKHKPKTRVSAALKPGFRVWQNGRVSPGPGVCQNPGFNPYSLLHMMGG